MQSFDAQFAAWVRTQPEDGVYDYCAPCGCAMYAFLSEVGFPVESVGPFDWSDSAGNAHMISDQMEDALARSPYTYGALAQRLAA